MAWQSTAPCQQLGLGPEHTILSLTCHRHTRHHVPRALLLPSTGHTAGNQPHWNGQKLGIGHSYVYTAICYNTDHRQGNILIQYFSMYGTEESQNTIHTGLVKQQIQPPSGFCNRQSHVRKGSAAASHSLSHQCGTFRQPDMWFSKLE